MRRRVIVLVLLALSAAPEPADAWGFEVHRYIVARAIPLLPPEIRPFFERFKEQIVEHSIDPDLWRTAGWEVEPPRHFVDMDAYGAYPFKDLPRDFDQAVARYGRDFVIKNGTLPWRTNEIFDKLTEAFAQKSPYARENIKFFSSVIAHYVADGHVPLHAALNYDGQLSGQWGVHSRFESELFDRYRPTLQVKPSPIERVEDARDLVFEVLLESFPLVEPILVADRKAVAGRDYYDDAYYGVFFGEVRPVLERRLGDAITRVASVIASAWQKAGQPALPLEPPRTPRKVRRQ